MTIIVPWKRPGFLQGAHPLLLAYLHGSDATGLAFKDQYVLDNIDQRLLRVKRRAAEVALRLLAAAPNVSTNATIEFLANRGSMSLSELFMDDPESLVFTHTVPYPLEGKFILHYENPSTLFYPFLWYSAARNFRLYQQPFFHLVRAVLESENCKLIFCHMQTFRERLAQIFRSEAINRKTRLIRPHLPILNGTPGKQVRTVMFSNSFGSSDERFFLRGGLAAVSAYLNVARKHPQTKLVILSNLPDALPESLKAALLANPNVTVVQPGITEQKLNSICAEVDVLLNPSTGLHSMNILRAMSAGALVIASDVVGNEEYITHGENGIILAGARQRVNFSDPESGLGLDDYGGAMEINQEYVAPLSAVLEQVVSEPANFHRMRMNAVKFVSENFTYGQENCNLWDVISEMKVS